MCLHRARVLHVRMRNSRASRARGSSRTNAATRAPLPMALSRPLFVGFSSASKVAREGGDLEVTVQTALGPRTFTLPWFFVRQVDALLERWRREEHEATLLTMNDGVLGATLCEAARAGGLRDSTFLLARGANIEHEHEEWTALLWSAHDGRLAVATLLLDSGAAELDSALLFSSGRGHTHVAALLLDRGADLHILTDAPLRDAARNGHLETARLLLDRGADVHVWNECALQNARRNGHEAIVALLFERGAVEPEESDDEDDEED